MGQYRQVRSSGASAVVASFGRGVSQAAMNSGDRVILSASGRQHHLKRLHARLGTITQKEKYVSRVNPNYVLVLWDGCQCKVPVPRRWLEVVEEKQDIVQACR